MDKTFKLFYLFFTLFFYGAYGSTHTGGKKQCEAPKRILIFCDMWEDHRMAVGGTEMVVCAVRDGLRKRGHDVRLMGFADVTTYKIPFMDENYFAWPFFMDGVIKKKIKEFNPHHIFIPLLGTISNAAARYCAAHDIPFTAFYSILGTEFFTASTGMPLWFSRSFIHKFLCKATNIVVPTDSARSHAAQEGFANAITWPHGVDQERFTMPAAEEKAMAVKACGLEGKPRPYYLFVGRVSEEKNFSAFLQAKVAGTKVVVGKEGRGFSINRLKKEYPDIVFAGKQVGPDLVKYYHAADIFLFPSKLDTFGLVMLEALSCGAPVVGFNTYGLCDVVPQGCGVSYLANSLDSIAELEACAGQAWSDLQSGVVTPEKCRAYASKFSWSSAIEQLQQVLVPTGLA